MLLSCKQRCVDIFSILLFNRLGPLHDANILPGLSSRILENNVSKLLENKPYNTRIDASVVVGLQGRLCLHIKHALELLQ